MPAQRQGPASTVSSAFLDNARQVAHKVVTDGAGHGRSSFDLDSQPMEIKLPIEPRRPQAQPQQASTKLPTALFESGPEDDEVNVNSGEEDIPEP